MHLLLALALLGAAPDSVRPAARPVPRTEPAARLVIFPVSEQRIGRWYPQPVLVQGAFRPSFLASLAGAIPDSVLDAHERLVMALDLAARFRWQVDFARDLERGGQFTITFERYLSSEGEVRYGRLLGAELAVGKRTAEAFVYDLPDGRAEYYDARGRSLERNFLSAPVEFQRVTSGYTLARFHPILQQWRAHRGIDYGAEPGTPVLAVGDGTVLRAGWAGAYGQLVEIRHANGVITRYGHLRGFAPGLRAGSVVRQGDCVGYVGSTGLATGPHLHFELRLNGVPVDPLRVPAGDGTPIPAAYRADFDEQLLRHRLMLSTAFAALSSR